MTENRLQIGDSEISVELRRNPRARRYNLRISRTSGAVVVTIPASGSLREGLAFARSKSDWIAVQLAQLPREIVVQEGALIPLRGVDHQIIRSGKTRGLVEVGSGLSGPLLIVPGEPTATGKKLERYFREEARADITESAAWHADHLGKWPKSIQIKDTSSRWGSCSSAGVLSFSWRIVMAPEFALDYLVAHEVAHLQEMNHSADFWAVVRTLCPDMDRGRKWLRTEGSKLHAVRIG